MLKVYGLVVGNGRTVWARPRDVDLQGQQEAFTHQEAPPGPG